MYSIHYRQAKSPMTLMWSLDEVIQRWNISISVFAHIFLAEGPGGERSNFLNNRAGFASRMARFRHQVLYIYNVYIYLHCRWHLCSWLNFAFACIIFTSLFLPFPPSLSLLLSLLSLPPPFPSSSPSSPCPLPFPPPLPLSLPGVSVV